MAFLLNLSVHIPIPKKEGRCRTDIMWRETSWFLRSNGKRRNDLIHRPTNLPIVAASTLSGEIRKGYADYHIEVLKKTRQKFCEEISFRVKDKDVSLAKAMLFVAAEDEAFMSFNRDMDVHSVLNERGEVLDSSKGPFECTNLDTLPLAGKSILAWLLELDALAKQVEVELDSKEIGCHLVQVLEVVNAVLFDLRGFTRTSVLVDPKHSHLHTVLSSASGSAIMLGIIYMEVCRRLGITIIGAQVGEEFLIWPQTGYTEELFKLSQGQSWFARVNGSCVKDPRSKASDLNSKSLTDLELASNRDIVGIALANLKRLHWKRASKACIGLMLTSPLRLVCHTSNKSNKGDGSNVELLRPQDLRLATMASERLLILQPHNWALRRDHGMLLYHSRRYGEAVQELSICMALAPVEEAHVLESFVEKLHLMRLESSWKSVEPSSTLTSLS